MKTFLFYDVETSGLNPAFDQILTFACIRTDTALSEIDRHSFAVQLRKDIIPSPEAVITHCLTPEVLNAGLTEYQAALSLHQSFNTPETISVGYNSLGFDDAFLRFLFYRNLLDPYAHQYANGCFRADMLPLAALYRVFSENVIDWPVSGGGQVSLKLEHISKKNDFQTSGRAHDAMADVEALVALSRAFRERRDVWDYALGFFEKNREISRLNGIGQTCRIGGQSFPMGIMVSASFGPDANYLAPVIHIGDSLPYKNQSLWLRLDRPDLFEIDESTGLFNWFVIRKKMADQWIVLPCLDRFWDRLTPDARDAAAAGIERACQQPGLFYETVRSHLEFKYPFIPDLDPDAALYQSGFFTREEKREMARFHAASGDTKAKVYETLEQQRVKILAGRILSRNYTGIVFPEFADHLQRLLTCGDAVKGYREDVKYDRCQGLADIARLQEEADGFDPVQEKAFAWVVSYIGGLDQ